jgi:hypothetical protein
MNGKSLRIAVLLGAAGLHTAAGAQDIFSDAEVVAGVSVGAYTNTGDASIMLGGFVLSDWRVAENLFAGAELNGHLGLGAVDADFSALGRFGYRFDGGVKTFVRGGYHLTELGRTRDNFLVGIGIEAPAGGAIIRGTIDRPGFGSTRLTTGIGWRF